MQVCPPAHSARLTPSTSMLLPCRCCSLDEDAAAGATPRRRAAGGGGRAMPRSRSHGNLDGESGRPAGCFSLFSSPCQQSSPSQSVTAAGGKPC
jgi:hypothetical protein